MTAPHGGARPQTTKASERAAWMRTHRQSIASAVPYKQARLELLKRYGKAHFEEIARKQLLRRSLKEFVKGAWHVLEPGTPLVWGRHLDVMCEQLERVTKGEVTRLIINVPPGFAKSMICAVMWPAWQWLENPGRRMIAATYVQRLTLRDAAKCLRLVQSDWYRALIPQLYGRGWNKAWELTQENVTTFATSEGGMRDATSVEGTGTGLRGDDVLIDDPMNAAEYPTPEALEAVSSWFDVRMRNRLNDMQRSSIVLIMQRLHEADLVGHLLAQDAKQKDNPDWVPFTHVCLPAEYEPDRSNVFDWRTNRGELLFPERFPKKVLDGEKIAKGAQYHAQYQQQPVPTSGGIFPMRSIRFWYPRDAQPPMPWHEKDEDGGSVPCEQVPFPDRFDVKLTSWDLSFKKAETSDFVAGQCWGALAAKRCNSPLGAYLLDQAHLRAGLSGAVAQIKAMAARHPDASATYVELAANGFAAVESLQSEIYGTVGVKPDGGKIARMWAAEPMFAAGNVYLPHPDLFPWVKTLLDELRSAPRGAHDDCVDACTQALAKIKPMLSQVTGYDALCEW